LFSDDVSLEKVAEHWVRKSTFILNKGIEYRKTQPQDRFLDINYDDLVDNAEGILEEIYKGRGGIPEELMQQFIKAEQDNPPRKYGVHQYSLDDFGLSEEDIEARIKEYRIFMDGIHRPWD